MIRVIQRRLIIPRGDTGTFTLPLLPTASQGDTAVFSIYDPLTKTTLLQKEVEVSEQELNFEFSSSDTKEIEPSDRYQWDVRIYHTPVDENDKEQIDSYYSAFSLPPCEIRPAP